MRDLYICDYPYLLYSAIIKASFEPDKKKDILLTNSYLEMEKMLEPLKASEIFENVFFFDDEFFRDEYKKILAYSASSNSEKNIFKKFFTLLKGFCLILKAQKTAKGIVFNFPFNPANYNTIYYTERVSTLMFYLNGNGIMYTAMEHGKDVWKIKPRVEIVKLKVFEALERLHICDGIGGFTKACTAILVNDKSVIKVVPSKAKVIEWNIDKCVQSLTASQKNLIYQMYARAYSLHLDFSKQYVILLTNPLYADSFVPSEDMHIKFYSDMLNRYFKDVPLLIKAHPRDRVDYEKYFPAASIIPNSIPSEVLVFSEDLNVFGVLTIFSSSIHAFRTKTDNLITLSPKNFLPNSIEILQPYRTAGPDKVH